jgi:hypothetical protein
MKMKEARVDVFIAKKNIQTRSELMLQEVCKMSSRELHWLVWEDPGLF